MNRLQPRTLVLLIKTYTIKHLVFVLKSLLPYKLYSLSIQASTKGN